MSCMDKFPEMKGFYVIMDDESIHTSNKVQNMIKKKREYGCIHRPPYSSELNLLEQYCFGVKFRLQHIQFGDREDLHTRITEA